MKRFINAFFVLTAAAILSFVFAGCTQQAEQPEEITPPSVEQAEHPAETEQPAKTEHPSGEHPK